MTFFPHVLSQRLRTCSWIATGAGTVFHACLTRPQKSLAVALSAACLAGTCASPAWAAGPKAKTPSPAVREAIGNASAAEAGAPASEQIELNYLSSGWKKVLSDVARQSGLILVADQIPEGRFSRRDKTEYSLNDALKILNRELEPEGFRLVRKANFLVLVDVPSMKARYLRPAYPTSRRTAARTAEIDETGTEVETAEAPADTKSVARAAHRAEAAAAHRAKVRRVNANQVEEEAAETPVLRREAPAQRAVEERDAEEEVQIPVSMRHRTATDLAGVMFKALKSSAKLIDAGPEGLPGFEATITSAKAGASRLTVEIDQDRNELLVRATPELARSTARLIRKMDVPKNAFSQVKLVPSTKDVKQIAETIQPELNRLREASAEVAQVTEEDRAAQPRDEVDPETGLPQVDPDNPQLPGRQPAPGDADLPGLLGGLKGDVSVEALPDLGVMILRGNQKDVDAVMSIIREIERLSVGTAPDVSLLRLNHVNSEALATLLTSVYERLGTSRGRPVQQAQQTVSFFPVVAPNALLVVASEADMADVERLVEELDKPTDPSSEFQVFRLKSAVASQVVQMLETFYDERPGLGARVLAIADVRTNAVIVQARPRDLQEVAALISKIDRNDSNSTDQMRIFALRHAVADELAEVIQTAIQSVINPPRAGGQQGGFQGGQGTGTTGQGAQELREARSSVVQFLSSDGRQERLVRSGIISDIRVTADGRTNSLLVTAPAESMQLMAELILQLDRPASTVAEIKVFSLANGDATTMAELLQTLFAAQQQGQGQGQDPLGIQVAGAEDASSGLIPLRFSVDARTNSIIAIGGAEALRVVEAILLRLDESDIRQRQTQVYRLKNSPALEVATAINQFLTSQRDVLTADQGLVSPFEQIEREVVVVPEQVSNSLLISATPRFFAEIRDLVIRLDAAPAQVIIQALLVEVELDNTDEFGMEVGLQDSVLFDRSVINNLLTVNETTTAPNGTQTTNQRIISQTATPGFLFNNQQLGNNTAINPSAVGSQGLGSFGLGRVNNDLGYGGLVLSASSESVSVLLRALASKRRVDILSRPQIRTLDNQLALMQVGQQVPVIDGVSITAVGSANPVIRQDNAGIILQVTPRISPDGMVVMEVIAEKSRFQLDAGVPIFTDATTGNVIRAPIKDISTARAAVSVSNEQTVVLGGMITKDTTVTERKVPYLGDIPIIGIPFRYDFSNEVRTELLIFLTPRVIRTDADSEFIKQVEIERMHFTEQEAEAMHGPILAAPIEVSIENEQEICLPELAPPEVLEDGMLLAPGFDESQIPTTRMPHELTPIPEAPPSDRQSPAFPPEPPGAAGIESFDSEPLPPNAGVNRTRTGRVRLAKLFRRG